MSVISKSGLRSQFFDSIFGDRDGYLCIATSDPRAPKSRFEQRFFEWPRDSLKSENYIQSVEGKLNVYYCANLLNKPERKKANCLPSNILWADLDAVDPSTLAIPANILVQTSQNRWQGLWLLTTELEPVLAEQYNKRIAYAMGADKSGWDLTQLLRVPLTRNRKYEPAPEITLHMVGLQTKAKPLLFETLPTVIDEAGSDDPLVVASPMPTDDLLPLVEKVIYKYSQKLDVGFTALFTHEPEADEDWSKGIWRLIHICFEAGMDENEVFVVANESKVNKYRRDGRPIAHLWREVLKAQQGYKHLTLITSEFKALTMPILIDPDSPIHEDLFIDRYRTWAIEATDAVAQFHDLSAAILLSTVIANSVRLETSYGLMVPNIWGMILGDSTLSRKTTAMRMVTDLIVGIDPELVLATDGTAEGLLTGLETRPNKTSIFYKDELSGFFESINRREYLAGMPETLTALYDVPAIYTRRLRKETIRIESPVFIFFGGGVRDKVYEALTEGYVLSGFLPRFLIVSGDTDLELLRRTGPPTEAGILKRSNIVAEIADMHEFYAADIQQRIMGQLVQMPPRVLAHLTNEAWSRYGDLEMLMVNAASNSSIPGLALPTFERLSRSLLKLAIIIGASRQVPKDDVIMIEKIDIDTAAHYIQLWGEHSIEAIMNAGVRIGDRVLDRIEQMIKDNPGILRSTIMQHRHLTKREADEILGTLEDRGSVIKERQGRGFSYRSA